MSSPGPHSGPHFNRAGLCVCACDECTARLMGTCWCPDCPCDCMGDRGDEHRPDNCGELETGDRVIAVMPGGFGLSGTLFDLRTPAERLPTFGTYCSPTSFLRIKSPEEIAADERREGAEKSLAVLHAAAPDLRGPSQTGQPCASCAFSPAPFRPGEWSP